MSVVQIPKESFCCDDLQPGWQCGVALHHGMEIYTFADDGIRREAINKLNDLLGERFA